MSSIIVPSWFNPSGYHEPENQLASPKWQAPPNQILYVMRPRQNVACERCHVDHMPTCLSISLVQSFYPIYSVENCNMHSNVSRIMYWKILEDNHWNEMKWRKSIQAHLRWVLDSWLEGHLGHQLTPLMVGSLQQKRGGILTPCFCIVAWKMFEYFPIHLPRFQFVFYSAMTVLFRMITSIT